MQSLNETADPSRFIHGFRQGGPDNFFSYQHISQRAVWTSLKKQLDPMVQLQTYSHL